MTKKFIAGFNASLIAALCLYPSAGSACTVGTIAGVATADGRPVMFKNRDNRPVEQQRLSYYPASNPGELAYIGVHTVSGGATMGLNEAGLGSGNSAADCRDRSYIRNAQLGRRILTSCRNIDEVRAFIEHHINLPVGHPEDSGVSGTFPFIDAQGRAVLIEVSKSKRPGIGIWTQEYDAMNPKRWEQDLFGLVPRANRFHKVLDGTDKVSFTDHYKTARVNMQGLRDLGILSARTLIQGCPDKKFEVLRNNQHGTSADIARWWTLSTIVVHGVKPGEDPALTTMWTLLGKPDFCIAVPAWVRVSDIPAPLGTGLIWNHTESLYKKAQDQKSLEETVQASTFPAEAHIFDMVDTVLLPHWRANGVPSVEEMTRVQHQIASDAYSLLKCLDETRVDNKAPAVGPIEAVSQAGSTVRFSAAAHDPDGTIESTTWGFGDGTSSTEAAPKHTYEKPGTYLVSFTAEDNEHVTTTAWKFVTVK